jgi:hypothetical protein
MHSSMRLCPFHHGGALPGKPGAPTGRPAGGNPHLFWPPASCPPARRPPNNAGRGGTTPRRHAPGISDGSSQTRKRIGRKYFGNGAPPGPSPRGPCRGPHLAILGACRGRLALKLSSSPAGPDTRDRDTFDPMRGPCGTTQLLLFRQDASGRWASRMDSSPPRGLAGLPTNRHREKAGAPTLTGRRDLPSATSDREMPAQEVFPPRPPSGPSSGVPSHGPRTGPHRDRPGTSAALVVDLTVPGSGAVRSRQPIPRGRSGQAGPENAEFAFLRGSRSRRRDRGSPGR